MLSGCASLFRTALPGPSQYLTTNVVFRLGHVRTQEAALTYALLQGDLDLLTLRHWTQSDKSTLPLETPNDSISNFMSHKSPLRNQSLTPGLVITALADEARREKLPFSWFTTASPNHDYYIAWPSDNPIGNTSPTISSVRMPPFIVSVSCRVAYSFTFKY